LLFASIAVREMSSTVNVLLPVSEKVLDQRGFAPSDIDDRTGTICGHPPDEF
jgi:hypothetical protein